MARPFAPPSIHKANTADPARTRSAGPVFSLRQISLQPEPDHAAGPVLRRKCAACDEEDGQRIQPKLRIGAVADPLEREADHVAGQVMRMADPSPRVTPGAPRISRACAACGHTADMPGGAGGDHATADRAAAAVRRGGTPLPGALRAFFEPRFGQDFAAVRLHTGPGTAEAAASIGARAYTLGRGIGFASGAYQPASETGRRLIAHELAHVVQQGGSAALLQRQEDDEVPAPPGPGARGLPIPNLDSDPTALSEPHCPPVPTNLGNLAPAAPCPTEGEDLDGFVFQFCADSDVFSDRGDLDTLRHLVSSSTSGSIFRIRAYSSVEGPGNSANADLYNHNLSCHRLNRMIRELLNLSVQEQQIDAAAMGSTERFGKGAKFEAENRVAILGIDSATPAARPDATGMSIAQIRDAARQDIAGGNYPTEADAYVARWSCGRWRTLADAVGRTTVLIEGQGTRLGAGKQLGTTAATGEDTIILSPDIADATDPIGCAANRITDLTFHHLSRPILTNFEDQHRAGMHLVFLANYPACRIPRDPLGAQVDVIEPPVPVDPFIGFIPHCADTPLAGPLGAQKGPATMQTPPSFTLNSLTLAGTSGGVGPSPSNNPLTVGVEPDQAFELHAAVDAVGSPASVGNYEIGFVQTVMAETWINRHADGRREQRHFPLPLRDGPPRDDPASAPPWFDANAVTFAAPGTNIVTMADAPNFRAFRFLPDLASTVFVQSMQVARPGGGTPVTLERPTFDPRLGPPLPAGATKQDIATEQQRIAPLLNNVPDRGVRALDFNTWVVARRASPPAAATNEETQFIAGLRLTFRLNANWTSTPGGAVSGAGSYSVTSRAATDVDAAAVMLRGATALDFTGPGGVPLFAEFLDIDPAVPRAQANGLDRSAYSAAVASIAAPHRTTPALRAALTLRVRIDVTTGRVILDTPDLAHGAVTVVRGPDVINTPEMQSFTRAVFPEIRKLTAGPGFAPNEPANGVIPLVVSLQPL
jgi:hypothetical protein